MHLKYKTRRGSQSDNVQHSKMRGSKGAQCSSYSSSVFLANPLLLPALTDTFDTIFIVGAQKELVTKPLVYVTAALTMGHAFF